LVDGSDHVCLSGHATALAVTRAAARMCLGCLAVGFYKTNTLYPYVFILFRKMGGAKRVHHFSSRLAHPPLFSHHSSISLSS
jgi:hypothetical protein